MSTDTREESFQNALKICRDSLREAFALTRNDPKDARIHFQSAGFLAEVQILEVKYALRKQAASSSDTRLINLLESFKDISKRSRGMIRLLQKENKPSFLDRVTRFTSAILRSPLRRR